MNKSESYMRERLAEIAGEVQRFAADTTIPDVLIELSLERLIVTAFGFCGPRLCEMLGERWQNESLRAGGFCHQCGDAQLAPIVSHLPICETCDAKNGEEAERIEREYGTEKPE